jgi:hypothetical protein
MEAQLDKSAEHESLRCTAKSNLEQYLWLVAARTKRVTWANYLTDENSPRVQEIMRKWNWLLGIWQAFGVRQPTEEKLKEMANLMRDRQEENERARSTKPKFSYWPELQ